MHLNLPNRLSILRLVLSCGFVAVLSCQTVNWSGAVAFVIFVAAGLTDFLDGHLARKYHLITDLGKLLDPIADKIMVSAAFIELVAYNDLMPVVTPAWLVICVLAREFFITGLRSLAAAKGVILAAARSGKHKTISQIVTILVGLAVLSCAQLQVNFSGLAAVFALYQFLLWLTLFITVWSGAAYVVKNYQLVLATK
ncbi:MAG: CDP-diacylglycerol--glycerol-3-phosphate 3-phosphatidyltransferase [Verrucomicrobiales bacterium]|nr:CDP-diacylglycerol--glycerol-3-phosphate 3-phosphatidyltransferase [Verrucomicrobiales bacterium]MDR1304713.1 CDP-diacylglycerol--glycerol-3-phosphate 3-phosphatidyltransferase [Verrucomicrobiales bacterium]